MGEVIPFPGWKFCPVCAREVHVIDLTSHPGTHRSIDTFICSGCHEHWNFCTCEPHVNAQ